MKHGRCVVKDRVEIDRCTRRTTWLGGRLTLLILRDPIDDRVFDGLLDLLVQVVGVFWR